MRLCYAFRRATFHPFNGGLRWGIPDGEARTRYLKQVKKIGFDGIELGFDSFGGLEATEKQSKELQNVLRDAGLPCVAIRAGGGLCQPSVAKHNRRRLEKAVQIAGWVGAEIVNSALGSPPRSRADDSGPTGAIASHGSSQTATEEDFMRTAKVLREVGELAGAVGVDITIEVHQHSIADNSWATLHLLAMTGSPHVFANPDLGNIYWTYDIPEQSSKAPAPVLSRAEGPGVLYLKRRRDRSSASWPIIDRPSARSSRPELPDPEQLCAPTRRGRIMQDWASIRADGKGDDLTAFSEPCTMWQLQGGG